MVTPKYTNGLNLLILNSQINVFKKDEAILSTSTIFENYPNSNPSIFCLTLYL